MIGHRRLAWYSGDSMPLAPLLLVIATLAAPRQDPDRPGVQPGRPPAPVRGRRHDWRQRARRRRRDSLLVRRPARRRSAGRVVAPVQRLRQLDRQHVPGAAVVHVHAEVCQPDRGHRRSSVCRRRLQLSTVVRVDPPTTRGATVVNQDTNGVGGQAFGGIEMTFKDAQK